MFILLNIVPGVVLVYIIIHINHGYSRRLPALGIKSWTFEKINFVMFEEKI